MTIIASHCSAKLCASDCRIHVALHIVSKISAFVHSFFTFSLHGVQILSVDVVCETKVTGFCGFSFHSSRKTVNSASFRKIFAPIHQPAMARTSGCSGAPMMMTCRPRRWRPSQSHGFWPPSHRWHPPRTAHGRQSVIDFLPLPVGADDDAAARGHLLQAGHAAHPLGRQLGNDMVIVVTGPSIT